MATMGGMGRLKWGLALLLGGVAAGGVLGAKLMHKKLARERDCECGCRCCGSGPVSGEACDCGCECCCGGMGCGCQA